MGDLEHPADKPAADKPADPPVMESMGPIQMTSLAFPGNRFRGEILPELEKLKKAGIVRVVDLLLVRKDELGNVMVTTASDLDWDALAGHPGLVVCDATVSTPVYLQALERGADVVLHSATKFLTGQHDALLGATIARGEHAERLRDMRVNAGITASPDAASALLRGLSTLETRMRRHTETASELARRLEAHPAVECVRYPGYSGIISFDVADALAVETATTLIVNATSLGGARSSMEGRHRWEGNRIPAGLLRLSVGLEDVEPLWADLDQALGRTAHPQNL